MTLKKFGIYSLGFFTFSYTDISTTSIVVSITNRPLLVNTKSSVEDKHPGYEEKVVSVDGSIPLIPSLSNL